MTDDRTYRKRVSPAEATAEIRRQAGSQFDPTVVRIFIEKVLGQAWNE